VIVVDQSQIQIIERSELVWKKNKNQDSMMADRGIMVQDLFSSKVVFVNTVITPYNVEGQKSVRP
jgi:hypothetical protein